MRINVNPCAECGSSEHLKLERDTIGCQACKRYAVCTNIHGVAHCWNQQNPEQES